VRDRGALLLVLLIVLLPYSSDLSQEAAFGLTIDASCPGCAGDDARTGMMSKRVRLRARLGVRILPTGSASAGT